MLFCPMEQLLVTLLIGLLLSLLLLTHLASKKAPLFISSFKHKHVFITGGSSGIGLSIAKQALLHGAFVTLVSRSSANLTNAVQQLVNELPCGSEKIRYQVADVSDYKAISAAIKESLLWKPIDILVCNAGLTRGGYLGDTDVEELDLTVRTNLLGTIYPLHAALPAMKQRSRNHPTSVVIMSSLASLYVLYGHSVYTATKYAVRGLAEALRLELLPFSIKVNLICPGFVDTPFLDDADKEHHITEIMKKAHLYDRTRAESPNSVASYTLGAVKEGDFLVTTPQPVGFLFKTMARGFFPADSIGRSLLEGVCFFFGRLISMKHSDAVHREILQAEKQSKVK